MRLPFCNSDLSLSCAMQVLTLELGTWEATIDTTTNA